MSCHCMRTQVLGHCMSEVEYMELDDRSYAVGFSDAVLDAKRRQGGGWDLECVDTYRF